MKTNQSFFNPPSTDNNDVNEKSTKPFGLESTEEIKNHRQDMTSSMRGTPTPSGDGAMDVDVDFG